jgi:hypothetical protein
MWPVLVVVPDVLDERLFRGDDARGRGSSPGTLSARSERSTPHRRSSEPSTTPDEHDPTRTVRVTHPFHPWSGQDFLFLSVGHNWGASLTMTASNQTLVTPWLDQRGLS